ncbi:MAG: hypothetical protein AAGH15_18085 [Myxococcota bacterium]
MAEPAYLIGAYGRSLATWGAPDMVDAPTGVAIWEHDHDGLVYAVPARTVDDAVADFVIAQDTVRMRRGIPLTVLHDWSACVGYTPSARARLTRHLLGNAQAYERVAIAVQPAGRLLSLGVQLAASSMKLAGVSLRLYPRLEVALRALHLHRLGG